MSHFHKFHRYQNKYLALHRHGKDYQLLDLYVLIRIAAYISVYTRTYTIFSLKNTAISQVITSPASAA